MIVGIIQARTGSSRLPGKILMKAAGKTLLEHMIERISNSKKLDKIVIATTTKKTDDVIVAIADKLKIGCFRGSEDDVLDRYYNASEKYGADTVVRLCSDCPLLDGNIIDTVLEDYFAGGYDYASNLVPLPRTYPDGLSVEVFSSELLTETQFNAKKPSEREHVTFYMWGQPEKYKIHRTEYKTDMSKYRFNIDYHEDYLLLEKIFEHFYPKNKNFLFEDVIKWLEENPEIFKLNGMIEPNLGWLKSLEEDKKRGFTS
jgi:spore coat polysaccharide biosynthesis protein SpsF